MGEPSSAYEHYQALLDHKIARMGGLAEQNLGQSFDALNNHDPQLAQEVILADKEIDKLQAEIEEHVIQLISAGASGSVNALHVMAALKIAGDLERIGDLAKNIAKRSRTIAAEQYPKQLMFGISSMVHRALQQLKDVLDAYADRNPDLALTVWRRDEEIDLMYNSVFRALLTYMMEDPRNIGLCTHLLFGAKNLERIGDHTTNIAEVVYYMVNGTELPDTRPRSDTTSSTLIDVD